jgi:hypothetical protein
MSRPHSGRFSGWNAIQVTLMRIFASLLFLGLFAAVPALAQEAPPALVGRLAVVSGTVAFHRQGETVWSAAAVNYPVAAGTSLWTERNSRAEIRIGPDTIDMAGGTELDVDRLTAQATHLTLSAGRIYLHVRRLGRGESFAVVIPRGGVALLGPGAYDITAGSESEPARIAVFTGRARFAGGGADIGIDQGAVVLLHGLNPVTAIFARAEPDDFVAWCRARDFAEARLISPHYVSTEMTGYAELDHYGHWAEMTGYGAVWFPNALAPGWAPYRDGSWVWIAPWGWTWIDRAPWGFAPTHYGRWARIRGAWGWVPGRLVPSPVYAPALVAFVEGFSTRHRPLVAWFPLAPGEVYWPAYTRNLAYIRAVNAPVVRDVDRIALGPNGRPPRRVFTTRYINQHVAILVPERAFASARNAGRAILPITPARLARVPATFEPPRVRPVIAHPLPPPPVRRLAVAPIGRAGPHPAPFVKPPPHPMAKAAPQRPAVQPTILRGHPVPARPKPPAEVARPVMAPRPLPSNAAVLPPMPPKHPHAARRALPAPHRAAEPHGTVRLPPPERRETPHAQRWRRPPHRPVAQGRMMPAPAFRRPPERERPNG